MRWIAVLAVLCALPAHARAQPQATQASPYDRDFLQQAYRHGLEIVASSEAVVRGATDPRVKQLAERVRTDYTEVLRQLDVAAKEHGVELTDQRPRRTSPPLDEDAYVSQLIAQLSGEIDRYLSEVELGEALSVTSLAARLLPILRDNLTVAKEVEAEREPLAGGYL